MAAREKRVTNRKWVAKCVNPDLGDVYEAIAHSMEARMMFFYSDKEGAIICTNTAWKPTGNQGTAFKHCSEAKTFFEHHYVPRPSTLKRAR